MTAINNIKIKEIQKAGKCTFKRALYLLAEFYLNNNGMAAKKDEIKEIGDDAKSEIIPIPYYKTKEWIKSIYEDYDVFKKNKENDGYKIFSDLNGVQKEEPDDAKDYVISSGKREERLKLFKEYLDYLATKVIIKKSEKDEK